MHDQNAGKPRTPSFLSLKIWLLLPAHIYAHIYRITTESAAVCTAPVAPLYDCLIWWNIACQAKVDVKCDRSTELHWWRSLTWVNAASLSPAWWDFGRLLQLSGYRQPSAWCLMTLPTFQDVVCGKKHISHAGEVLWATLLRGRETARGDRSAVKHGRNTHDWGLWFNAHVSTI